MTGSLNATDLFSNRSSFKHLREAVFNSSADLEKLALGHTCKAYEELLGRCDLTSIDLENNEKQDRLEIKVESGNILLPQARVRLDKATRHRYVGWSACKVADAQVTLLRSNSLDLYLDQSVPCFDPTKEQNTAQTPSSVRSHWELSGGFYSEPEEEYLITSARAKEANILINGVCRLVKGHIELDFDDGISEQVTEKWKRDTTGFTAADLRAIILPRYEKEFTLESDLIDNEGDNFNVRRGRRTARTD